MLTQTLNTLWMWQSRREHRAFHAATSRIQQQQERLLQKTLEANPESRYGRLHRFASIKSLDDFQKHVPICDYESLKPQIDEITSGAQGILTSEPVLMMEPTGGSSGGSRLIPYTATLRQQFQRAISTWMHDVLSGYPSCRRGRAYWSISPAAQRLAQTSGGVRIGFDNDTEYLAGWQRWAMTRLLAVPPSVSQIRCIENFQYATLACLLATNDLALISIWSPTFLTTLFAKLPDWAEQIIDDIGSGEVHWPLTNTGDIPQNFPFRRNKSRSAFLQRLLQNLGPTPAFASRCWPSLSLVSAWGDATAAMFAPSLQSWLSGIPFQPKGLLATEGVTSFPLKSCHGSALAIRSHVFEFLPVETGLGTTVASSDDQAQRPNWAWELRQGHRYRILLTTGGGLYRYATGDEIEVTGFSHQCPLVKFTGRAGAQSDLVGEKLHEQHVHSSIMRACESLGVEPAFAMLTPTLNPAPGYRAILVLKDRRRTSEELSNLEAQLSHGIDERLCENSQYQYAIGLGQLRRLEAWILQITAEQAWSVYESECRRRGQKSGDIKPSIIACGADWDNVFAALHHSGKRC